MHYLKSAPKLAVTNYGLSDQNVQNVNDAESQTSPGATVTMEFAWAPALAPFSSTSTATVPKRIPWRLKFADLDGLGPKPVPFLCQVCHGGGPGLDGSNKAADAHFREFDLPTFRYSGARAWDYGQVIGPTTPSQAEFDKFANLNQFAEPTD